jgi:AraC-like DNA-binding protein
MIWGTKDMIAGCIDRTRRDACGGCERRDACNSLFKALGLGRPAMGSGERPSHANAFVAFLGSVAKAIEAGAKPRETPFRREVEQRIEPLLAAGPVRIDQVARPMGLSRQTLYRRLKAEGSTFEKVLDGLRRRLAVRLVRERLPVKEVAYRLGFSDPAAFSRAFKRWTGTSPSGSRS